MAGIVVKTCPVYRSPSAANLSDCRDLISTIPLTPAGRLKHFIQEESIRRSCRDRDRAGNLASVVGKFHIISDGDEFVVGDRDAQACTVSAINKKTGSGSRLPPTRNLWPLRSSIRPLCSS